MKDYLQIRLKELWSKTYDYLEKGKLKWMVFVSTKDLKDYKKYLAEAQIEIDTLRNVNKQLNLIIKEHLRKRTVIYRCSHCTFEGQ